MSIDEQRLLGEIHGAVKELGRRMGVLEAKVDKMTTTDCPQGLKNADRIAGLEKKVWGVAALLAASGHGAAKLFSVFAP